MKKLKTNNIKKYLPSTGLTLLFLFSVTYIILSYTALHNGADIKDFSDVKWKPVSYEVVILAITTIFLSFAWGAARPKNKVLWSISNLTIGMTLVSMFAYWALVYTNQDVGSGFAEIATVLVSVTILSCIYLLLERLANKLKRKRKYNNPLIRAFRNIDKRKEYICVCDKATKVNLGFVWAKKGNIILALIFIVFGIAGIMSGESFLVMAFVGVLIGLLYTWNYLYVYLLMKRAGHSVKCSKACARAGAPYVTRGSYPII